MCHAQPIFKHTYGFGAISQGKKVIQTFDHGYAIAGTTTPSSGGQTNFYLIKTDSVGNAEFHFAYGGSGIDQANSLVQLSDSGFLIAGYSNSFNPTGDYDACLVRTDKQGNSVWTKTIGTSDWDFVYDIQPTIDGNYILAGNSYGSGNGNSAAYLAKIDLNGTPIWQKFVQMDGAINISRIKCKADGSYILCGDISTSAQNDTTDGLIVFADANGDSTHTALINTNLSETLNAIDTLSSGDLMIAGTVNDTSESSDELIIRTTNTGSVIFVNRFLLFNSSSNDLFVFNDTVVVAASTTFSGQGKTDFHFVLYAPNGSIVAHTFGGSEDDFSASALLSYDHGYVFLGSTNSFGPGHESVLLVKFDTAFTNNPTVVIGIEEINNWSDLSIYPNPANELLSISTSKSVEHIDMNIFDVEGKLVESKENISIPYKQPITLKPGFYFISLSGKNFSTQKKFIVTN